MRWGSVPAATKELIVYFGRIVGEEKGTGPKQLRAPFANLIIGIDPKTRRIAAGTIPSGAYSRSVGFLNSCPERRGQRVLLQLFALKRPLRPPLSPFSEKSRWATELTEAALGIDPEAATSKWLAELTEEALGSGRIVATYGGG